MSPAPYKLGRSPPPRDDFDPAFPAAGDPAAGPSHVQVVRPRRCAAAGAPPGPATGPDGTQPAIAGTQHHPLASGPRLHREWGRTTGRPPRSGVPGPLAGVGPGADLHHRDELVARFALEPDRRDLRG